MVDESSKHKDLGVFGVRGECGSRFNGILSSSLSGSVVIASSSFTDSLQLVTYKFRLHERSFSLLTMKFIVCFFEYHDTYNVLIPELLQHSNLIPCYCNFHQFLYEETLMPEIQHVDFKHPSIPLSAAQRL